MLVARQQSSMSEDLVVSMSAVELGLSGHDRSHGRTSRQPVDRAREIELGLHLPQFLMLVRRKQLSWIPGGDPSDGNDRFRQQP